MGHCDHPNCSEPLIKPLTKVHDFLCDKSEIYHAWHHHPHHKKVHVGVLAVFLVLVGGLMYSAFPHNAGAASHFFANWEQGTDSFNATTSNGDGYNNGAIKATIVDGFNSSGALNVDPRESVRYNSLGNIDLSRSQIESNFRLKYPISGNDTTEFNFNNPGQIALDPSDPTYAYVADTNNNRIVRMHWGASGWDSWYAYGAQGSGVGQFSSPNSIVYDPTHQAVYVGDSRNCRVVRLHWNGSGWDSWRDYGYCGADPEQFNTMSTSFSALAFDSSSQTLIVGDPGRIIRVTWDNAAGDWKDWSEFLAGEGNNPDNIKFTSIGGLAWTGSDLYFVANVSGLNLHSDQYGDYVGDNLSVFGVHWSGSAWTGWRQAALIEKSDPQVSLVSQALATGLALGASNTLYVSPPGQTIDRFDISAGTLPTPPTGVTTFGANKEISTTSRSLAFDQTNGFLYMFDSGRTAPLIRVHANGSGWDTWSGNSTFGSATPGFSPTDVAYDSVGNTLFVADNGGNNSRIVAMHIQDKMASSWYGYGTKGTGTGKFYQIQKIAYDTSKNALYIIDSDTMNDFRVVRLHWNGSSFDDWYSFSFSSAHQYVQFAQVGFAFDSVTQGLYIALPSYYDPKVGGDSNHLIRLQWDDTTKLSVVADIKGVAGGGCHLASGPIGTCNFNFNSDSRKPAALAVDTTSSPQVDTGYIYLSNSNGSTNWISKLHWDTISKTFDSQYTYANPISDTTYITDMAFDSINKVIYFIDAINYHVFRMAWNAGGSKFDDPSAPYGKSGNIQDYAGSGGRSREGQFALPAGIEFDPGTGSLYVADTSNTRIARMKWDGSSTFNDWGTFTDPYHYIMSTSGQYPLRIRFNVATSRLEFFLSAGSKEIFAQTGKLNLSANAWYSFKVQYDSTNGKLLIGVYDTAVPANAISEVVANAVTWVAPTTLGGNFYIGSDKVTNYDQRAIGGAIDNFEISSLAPPPTPTKLAVDPGTYTTTQHFDFTWEAGASADDSSSINLQNYEYIINGTDETKANDANWTDIGTALKFTLDDPDPDNPNINFPAVKEGANVFTIRAKGTYDNYSPEASINFYWSDQIATAPENLTITHPTDPLGRNADNPDAENNFTLAWETPTGSTGGDANYLKYHYSVDAYPSPDNSSTKTLDCFALKGTCTTVSGVKATKQSPTPSIFFILSEGQNGLINWSACHAKDNKSINTIQSSDDVQNPSLCAVMPMYVSTPVPGTPENAQAKDTSNKDKQIFEDVLRWDPPVSQGNGVAAYEVCRSTDGTTWDPADCHETTETYFYQTGLESRLYYYKIAARDAAHQYGNYIDPIQITPTGDFKVPPVLKSDSVSANVKSSSATIRWSTQDEELKNIHKANSYIEYGTDKDHVGKAKGGFDQGSKEYVDDHEVKLTGLEPDSTKYYYRLVWYDINGNMGHYEQFDESKPFATVFTTGARPIINNMKVSDITLNSASISYETSVPATTEIAYGSDRNNLGSTCTFASNGYDTKHEIRLPCPELFNDGPLIKPLNHTSTYYYKIKGKDTDGEPLDIGAVYDFQTLTMPEIIVGSVQTDQDKEAPSTTYRFTWKTNIKTSSVVNYTDNKGKKQSVTVPDMTTDHSVTVPNLADQSIYSFEVSGVDEHWINVETPYTTSITTPKDSRPPKISNLTVEVKSSGFGTSQKAQLVITWETDEPGTSQVEYDQGISGDSYANKSKEDMAYSTSHAVILADLEPSKIYHLRAVSADVSGNVGHSEDTTTITGKQQNSVLDIIINSLQKSLGWLFGIFGNN